MKILKVPEEISDLFDEVAACNQCRDACIGSMFKARRAIYYAKQAVKANSKAWDFARDLWPETREGRWAYHYDTKTIHEHEGSNVQIQGAEPLAAKAPSRLTGWASLARKGRQHDNESGRERDALHRMPQPQIRKRWRVRLRKDGLRPIAG